jgi:putative endonuclease
MLATAWVYIITNNHNTTLYIGVTNDLPTRLWEHRTKQNQKCFSARYNLNKLVFYLGFETIAGAVEKEKYMKGKRRKWKDDLVTSMNPDWTDLTETATHFIKKGRQL